VRLESLVGPPEDSVPSLDPACHHSKAILSKLAARSEFDRDRVSFLWVKRSRYAVGRSPGYAVFLMPRYADPS
jgi:hypothetical protein